MVTFRELWGNIVNKLQEHSSEIGVASTDILHGVVMFEKGKIVIPTRMPPFIYVYAMPGDSIGNESGGRIARNAEIGILCAVKASSNINEAVTNAIELAEGVEHVIRENMPHIIIQDPIVEIADPRPDATRAILSFSAKYKSTKEGSDG